VIDALKPLIKQFLPFAQERMGFDRPPKLFLKQDSQNASNPLGKTAFYDPSAMSITLFVSERHPKDVMRSLSHELVHHTQNCNGDFKNAGEMGEGYAQNNPHMREMERQAYEMGNMCFRDWEDSIKGTIYNESLQKGVNEIMSTKNWKDRELNTLLLEKWGFKFNPDGLTEDTGGPAGELTPEEAEEEEGDRPYVSKEEEEGDLDEGFEKPKSATGSGPSNKAGKVDRSDVANKASGRWLKEEDEVVEGTKKGEETEEEEEAYEFPSKGEKKKTSGPGRGEKKGDEAYINEKHGEEEELEEMCPPESHMEPGEEMEGEMEEGGVEDLAARALSAVHELAAAAGVDISTTVATGEEEDELDERNGRGRADPRNQRGPADPRQRPVAETRIRKALQGRKITEKQMRQIIRKTMQLRQERKTNKR